MLHITLFPFLNSHLIFLLCPLLLHTDWISCSSPSLLYISSHFPDCSALSLNKSLCLIPSLLHQTNSYIIQRGNERVRGRTRPCGSIHLLYLPIAARPRLYLFALVGRGSCPSNYIGVRMIVHADEQPCDTLSISIMQAWQVNTHTHTHTHICEHMHTHNTHSCFF